MGKSLLSICIFFAISATVYGQPTDIMFVASTPANDEIRSRLSIDPGKKVEFIRWDLNLQNAKANQPNAFILNLLYGESEPNTLGFKGGGDKLSFSGKYTVSKDKTGNINGEIYDLKSVKLPAGIRLVKLNNNLLHLLTTENKLMIGDGGWSYTLNRKEPVTTAAALPKLTLIRADSTTKVIFEGRTPCQPFSNDHKLNVSSGCFKLKWKLTLNRDAQTSLPTTYTLQTTFNRGVGIEGKWEISKDVKSNATIYMLHPDNQQKSFSLVAGDENVLFFMDEKKSLYLGNADFSYTLNRIQQR